MYSNEKKVASAMAMALRAAISKSIFTEMSEAGEPVFDFDKDKLSSDAWLMISREDLKEAVARIDREKPVLNDIETYSIKEHLREEDRIMRSIPDPDGNLAGFKDRIDNLFTGFADNYHGMLELCGDLADAGMDAMGGVPDSPHICIGLTAYENADGEVIASFRMMNTAKGRVCGTILACVSWERIEDDPDGFAETVADAASEMLGPVNRQPAAMPSA